MLLRNLAIVAALCASSIQGFAPTATSMRVHTARNLMTADEVKAIMDEAESCSKGECAIDEVEDLISSLLTQQSLLSKRIAEIDGLVKDLEHVNGRDERPTDEIRETVRAIFRIFALGVSYFPARYGSFQVYFLPFSHTSSLLLSPHLTCNNHVCAGFFLARHYNLV